MNTESALELLRRGRPLAAALVPQSRDRLAWVGVYPLDLNKASAAALIGRLGGPVVLPGLPVFRLRVIEMDESLLRSESCICEDDLQAIADLLVVGEETLLNELDRLGVARDALELPYRVDYPI